MNDRIRRPEPQRTLPIRQWGTLFGVGGPTAGTHEASQGTDPVTQGVGTGYSVIDDYLRRGQAAARAYGSLWAGQGAVAGGTDPMSQWTQFASMWTELASTWMQNLPGLWPMPPEQAAGMAGPFTAHNASAAHTQHTPVVPRVPGAYVTPPTHAAASESAVRTHDAPNVTLDVTTSRRVTVHAEIRCTGGTLIAHDLRLPSGDARITGIVVETVPAEARVTVRMTVPDDAPSGMYAGAVIDAETGLPRGTLAVRVEP